MGEQPESPPGISRRALLTTGATAAIVGGAVGATGVALLDSPSRGPSLWTRPDQSGAQPAGADAVMIVPASHWKLSETRYF